jgi:hypothetical protein
LYFLNQIKIFGGFIHKIKNNMENAKEKAKELMERFSDLDRYIDKEFQKKCALVVVDEMIESIMERKWPDRDTLF